jgi:hypothetical protein
MSRQSGAPSRAARADQGDAVRRILTTVTLVPSLLVVFTAEAWAAYPPITTPPPIVTPARSPIPFTGANVSAGFLILTALLIVGGVLVAAGRRRRARTPR